MPSSGRERGEREREKERGGRALCERLREERRARDKARKRRSERSARRSREEEKGHDVRDGRRMERERPVRASYKIVVQRPTRNLLLLHRRTDGWTNERTDGRPHKQRISSSIYSPCIVHARERPRGPLCGRDDIGYRARWTGDRDAARDAKGAFISLTYTHARAARRSKRAIVARDSWERDQPFNRSRISRSFAKCRTWHVVLVMIPSGSHVRER